MSIGWSQLGAGRVEGQETVPVDSDPPEWIDGRPPGARAREGRLVTRGRVDQERLREERRRVRRRDAAAAEDPSAEPCREHRAVIGRDRDRFRVAGVPQVDVGAVGPVCRSGGEREPRAVRRVGLGLADDDDVAGDLDRAVRG